MYTGGQLGQAEVLRERAAGTYAAVYPTVPAGQTARQAALDYWQRVLAPFRPRPIPVPAAVAAPGPSINWWLVGGAGLAALGVVWIATMPPARRRP